MDRREWWINNQKRKLRTKEAIFDLMLVSVVVAAIIAKLITTL